MGAQELRDSRGGRAGPLAARTVNQSVFTFSVISSDSQVVCIGNGNLKFGGYTVVFICALNCLFGWSYLLLTAINSILFVLFTFFPPHVFLSLFNLKTTTKTSVG